MGTEVDAARPFDAAEIGVDARCIKDGQVLNFSEDPSATLRLNRINSFDTVIESDFEPITFKRNYFDESNHSDKLIQGCNFVRLLVAACQLPCSA